MSRGVVVVETLSLIENYCPKFHGGQVPKKLGISKLKKHFHKQPGVHLPREPAETTDPANISDIGIIREYMAFI